MSGNTTASRRTQMAGSDVSDVIIQHQKVITDLETLRATVDIVQRNRCLGNPAIARGTTATKIKTVNSVSFAIDGALFTKAGTDDFWTLGAAGANTTITDGNSNKYVLYVDNTGAATVVEGTQAATAGAVVLPALAASKSVFGVLTIATSGATFIPGTTALNAGTVTATFVNGLDPSYFSAGASAMTAAKVGDPSGTAITS